MAIYIYIIFYHFQKLFDPHILSIRKWLLPQFYSWRNWVSERLNDATLSLDHEADSVFCPFIPPAFHCTFCSSLLWRILELAPEWCLSVESIPWPHLDKFYTILSEKAMAPDSSTLAWKSPWTEEPGGLQSMTSQRVGHDWVTSLSLLTFTHWRRKWQPTPVFLPGESQGWGSLVGCHLRSRTESDTTEAT